MQIRFMAFFFFMFYFSCFWFVYSLNTPLSATLKKLPINVNLVDYKSEYWPRGMEKKPNISQLLFL